MGSGGCREEGQMTRKEALRLKKQFEQLTDKIQRELQSSLKGRQKHGKEGPLIAAWKSNMTIHKVQQKRLKLLVDVFYRTIDEALKR
jgi:hypothetical protein